MVARTRFSVTLRHVAYLVVIYTYPYTAGRRYT